MAQPSKTIGEAIARLIDRLDGPEIAALIIVSGIVITVGVSVILSILSR